MFTFLRKVRRSLMETGSVKKYILYAIGEIVLIVVGIMIALQINTWNENKKTASKVNELLIALQEDLIQDTLLINENLPFIVDQYDFNESLRDRVAKVGATLDTLIQIMRHEFNPNWRAQITYNTNAYNSLNQTGLIENLPNELKSEVKNFYNKKATYRSRIEKTTNDYQGKITSYVDTYTFGSTGIHDQGPLVDGLVWKNIDPAHLAATFQGISNFKRILFTETREELEFSLRNSRALIKMIDGHL
ncbi:MAG: hypothetical protein HKN68_21115 [Saprospiraceae bacterium]|nr:hypothetical protein [Saprospiraceae bacterium]